MYQSLFGVPGDFNLGVPLLPVAVDVALTIIQDFWSVLSLANIHTFLTTVLTGSRRRPHQDRLGWQLVHIHWTYTSYGVDLASPSSNELNASYAADGYARVMHGSGGAAKHGSVGALLTTYA